jgi:hypothetical protein
MDTTTSIVIASLVVIAILGIVVWSFFQRRRSERLRARFGPEYVRELLIVGDRRHAEAKLEEREKRIGYFHLRPLTPHDGVRYADSWQIAKARFVDNPGAAIAEADQLLGDLMITRGYPVTDFEQRAADISVDHPLIVENYRAAHAIALRHSQGKASTEEMRQAMIHYRALFENLTDQSIQERIAS